MHFSSANKQIFVYFNSCVLNVAKIYISSEIRLLSLKWDYGYFSMSLHGQTTKSYMSQIADQYLNGVEWCVFDSFFAWTCLCQWTIMSSRNVSYVWKTCQFCQKRHQSNSWVNLMSIYTFPNTREKGALSIVLGIGPSTLWASSMLIWDNLDCEQMQ